jgi:hypothetical protein
VGGERAVDLAGGSGNGTPRGRAGGKAPRLAERDQDPRPGRKEARLLRAGVPWQATGPVSGTRPAPSPRQHPIQAPVPSLA